MGLVTMRGMVWIVCHIRLVVTNDSAQVAFALAFMGSYLEATIKNF